MVQGPCNHCKVFAISNSNKSTGSSRVVDGTPDLFTRAGVISRTGLDLPEEVY